MLLNQAKLNAAREANAGGTTLCVVDLKRGDMRDAGSYVVRHYVDHKDDPALVWIAYPSTIDQAP